MAWNPSLSLNPEFVRVMRTTLPKRRALFVAGLTVVLLAAGAWVVWNRSAPSSYGFTYDLPDSPARQSVLWALQVKSFGAESYGMLTVLLFALLFVLGPALAGLSFVQERLRGTAIFQQMNLLSPFRLAAGKFWGAGALAYFVALLLLPCALAAAWLGEVNPQKVGRLYLFLLVGGFAWQALGLYASVARCGASERAPRGGLLVGPLVAVGGAVTALALTQFFTADYELMASRLAEFAAGGGDLGEYFYRSFESFWWYFYGARVPAYAVILGLVGFAGVWGFAGAVRRVKAWQLIPLSARPAWLFFGSACALATGLLWGRYLDDAVPVFRLNVYMLLCWGAVAALAGESALTRARLREWWSDEPGPLALLQRSEIKASVTTILVAAGFSLAGLFALWLSYHVAPHGNGAGYNLGTQFLPVALCFALTLAATATFVQLCAMFRFRLGGWAGVVLLVFVYAFAGVAGAMLKEPDNTPVLFNPLTYAEVITKGDYYLDSSYDSLKWSYDPTETRHHQVVAEPEHYTPRASPHYNLASATTRGLVAQSGFALLCLLLATLKWRQTRRDMLRDTDT
ncbi:MAG: hypothetical protein QOH49_5162 [Acidobacteriota bacterium]|jgi:hypothetical protein|nr:hypothetical protein [Acidobacteriota bacterium]